MQHDSSLLISLFNILPDEVDLYIQAPSLEDETILNLMSQSSKDYYKIFKLNNLNKGDFINHIETHPVLQFFQNIEIKNGEVLLFQGFDGVEVGILSKNVKTPEWFNEKYIITGDCTLSKDW
jgi:hypothetical protein